MDVQTLQFCQGFLHQFGVLVNQLEEMTRRLLVHFLTWHKGTMKLTYVSAGVVSTLLHQGFCRPQEEEESNGQTEDASGTGLGTGEGQKDVSEQIEDEEQLHKPEQQEDDQPVPEEEDKGVETAQDFASELSDVKPAENQDEEADSDEEEDDEEDNRDSQMGDVDREQEEVLDEQLWDKEDEDDLDEHEGEGKDVQSEQIEDELMANDDQEGQKPDKQEQEKSDPHGESDDEEQQDPTLSEDEELSDGEGSEESDQMDGDMIDIQDDEERNQFEELQGDKEFELPEEMNLDEEDLDEGQDDASMEEGEEPDEEQEAGDSEPEELSDGGEDKETDELDEENDEQDPEQPADPENAQAQDADAEENQDEEVDNEETLNKDAAQEQYDEETMEQQIGIRDQTGHDANVDTMEEQQTQMDEDDAAQDQVMDNRTNQQTDDSQGTWSEHHQQQKQENQQQQKQPQFDPNPYRSLGDATKKWEEKVKMIQDAPPSSEEQETPSREKQPDQNAAQEYQYENEADAEEDDEAQQALGAATEEQSQKVIQPDDHDDEEDDGKPSDDVMADTEEDAPPSPPSEKSETQKEAPAISSRTMKAQTDAEDEDEEMQEANEGNEKEEGARPAQEDLTEADERHDQPNLDPSRIETTEEQEEIARRPITPAEMNELRHQLEEKLAEWRSNPDSMEGAQQLWNRYEELTQAPSQELCEQLRLILEPTLATKLRGDYRSGKRINMKKVIPYIASQFRKDKIWLRRTKPNKRHYQVMISIDDSESMSLHNAGNLACEAMTMIAKSLSQLEVGELAIMKFGETVELVHPFDQPFTDSVGPQIISQFQFTQKGTNVLQLLDNTVNLLEQARMSSHSQTEHVQLVFIISDGRLSNKAGLGQWIREAEKKRMLIVFIIIDSPNSKDSILQLETVNFMKKKIVRSAYMDDFPFPYYVILHEMNKLPDVLADTLRQWFELSHFS